MFLPAVILIVPRYAQVLDQRFREGSRDWRNCEALFSEIIVYRNYIRAIHEGLIQNIELNETESDVIIERAEWLESISRSFLRDAQLPDVR